MPKLIEIHMIQNHSPANLNRDDLGAPKTCIFGGALRARISSQCQKRAIRRAEHFRALMEECGGVRTRRLVDQLAQRVSGADKQQEELLKFIMAIMEEGGLGIDPEKVKAGVLETSIIVFIPRSALDEMAAVISKAWKDAGGKVKNVSKDTVTKLAAILAERVQSPDIALFGRMTEIDRQKPFGKSELGVEAALQAAHPISTHEIASEVDYFTAVDDFGEGPGASQLGEAQFNSACFYKYFSIDWEQLVANLTTNGADKTARDLAARTVGHFIEAAAHATPSGKQNSHAAHNRPDGILIEVKDTKLPTSYANAFADPVPPKSERGLVGESIARLGQFVGLTGAAFQIGARRFWFTPDPVKYPLLCAAPKPDGRDYEPPKEIEGLVRAGTLEKLIAQTIKAIDPTFDWSKLNGGGARTEA